MLLIHHTVQETKLQIQSDVKVKWKNVRTFFLLWLEIKVRKVEENGQKRWLVSYELLPWKPLLWSTMQMSSFLEQGQSWATSPPPEMATTGFDSFQTAGYHPLVTHENIISEKASSWLYMYIQVKIYFVLQPEVTRLWSWEGKATCSL